VFTLAASEQNKQLYVPDRPRRGGVLIPPFIPYAQNLEETFCVIPELTGVLLAERSAFSDPKFLALKISHVSSLAAYPSLESQEKYHLEHLTSPKTMFINRVVDDDASFNPINVARGALEDYLVWRAARTAGAKGFLVFHCQAGRSRSVCAVIMLMCTLLRMSFEAAKRRVQTSRQRREITQGPLSGLRQWGARHDIGLARSCGSPTFRNAPTFQNVEVADDLTYDAEVRLTSK